MVQIANLLSDKERGINVTGSKDYISLSRKGLSVKQLKKILTFTNLSIKDIAAIISVSVRQLARYDDDKILRRDISAHLILITELYRFGYDVLEHQENFQKWMHTKIRGLGYQKPIELLDTPFGIQDIKNELGRLEHGVYS